MNLYNFTGRDKNGDILKGQIEAESEGVAARILASRNIIPISFSVDNPAGFHLFERMSLKDKVILVRQLSTMINAGLPIAQSIETILVQMKKPFIRKVLSTSLSDIEGGATLSMAFSKYPKVFRPLDVALIKAGETSGTLDKALLTMSEQLEKQQGILRKVRGALIYPAFVLVVVIGVMIAMLVYVMPQMKTLYDEFNAKLPFLTLALIALSDVMVKYSLLFIMFVAALIFFCIWLIKRPFGRRLVDRIKLSTPLINVLFIKMYMARFSRTLSGLIGSGVPLLDSLAVVSNSIGNVIYKDLILAAAEKVKSGVALSETLKVESIIPPVVPQMVSVGEKTGELDKMLSNLAGFYEDEVDVAVKSISGLIEPLMIVVLGGAVAVIMLAIMLPIYQVGKIVGS